MRALTGDRCGRWEQSGAGAARSFRHHQRVVVGAAAALPPDAQWHLGRKELHHHLPAADRDADALHAQGGRQRRRPRRRRQGGTGQAGRCPVLSAGHARRMRPPRGGCGYLSPTRPGRTIRRRGSFLWSAAGGTLRWLPFQRGFGQK